jgi:sterol desaturase/sphingolipid hydroxylase (fatty acid hydroxylase superfamily)
MSGTNQSTLIQTHPSLIAIFGAKNPRRVFLYSLPLFIFFAIQAKQDFFSITSAPESVGVLSVIAGMGGLLYWSLFEYLVHRYPYHLRFKSARVRWFIEAFHLYHHKHLNDKRVLNTGPFTLYPLAFVLLSPWGLLMRGSFYFWIFAIALLSAYVFYEYVHFSIHMKHYEKGYLAYIQRYHLYHHDKAWGKNFGNTSPLWDKILGTYDAHFQSHRVGEI